jgi:outer membrane murein-binding lipoprotein Lpp
MSEIEPIRARILAKLAELLGDEEAAAIMESIPPFDWSELATKSDLAGLELKVERLASNVERLASDVERLPTREDLLQFRVDTPTKTEMADAITSTEARMASRIESMEHRIEGSLHELRAEMHATVHAAFMRVVTLLVPTTLTGIGIAFTAAKFT